MMRALIILVVLLMPVSSWAWKPVADSDLSNVSSPASLNIKPRVPAELSGNGSVGGLKEKDKAVNKFSFLSLMLGNNESVLPSQLKKTETEEDMTGHLQDINKIENLSNDKTYSIQYPDGQKDGSNTPIITDLKPDGHTQLRVYYTNDTSSYVLPKSWVNIVPR